MTQRSRRAASFTAGAAIVAASLVGCAVEPAATPQAPPSLRQTPTSEVLPTRTPLPTPTPTLVPADSPLWTGRLGQTARPGASPEEAIRNYFSGLVPGTRSIKVSTMAPEGRLSAERAVYRVGLDVERDGSPSDWNDGSNVRWVSVQRTAGGWSVGEMATSPLAGGDGTLGPQTYGRVGGLELGLTFEVPAWWQQDGSAYVWRTGTGSSAVAVGVEVYSLSQVPEDFALLPKTWRTVSRQQVDLGWGRATQYVVDLGPGSVQETHVVVRGKVVYDFYSSAPAGSASAQTTADETRLRMLKTVVLLGG